MKLIFLRQKYKIHSTQKWIEDENLKNTLNQSWWTEEGERKKISKIQ